MISFKQYVENSVIRPSFLYKKTNKDENIIAAAIYDKLTGYYYTGDSHEDAYFHLQQEEGYEDIPQPQHYQVFKQTDKYKSRFVDGFYTDNDKFLTRSEALEFMRRHKKPVDREDLDYEGKLHSNVVQDYLAAK